MQLDNNVIWWVVGIAVALFLVILFAISYIKAAPDEAIIVSGFRKKPKVLIGRSGFRIPFLERKDVISLKLMTISLNKTDPIPTKDYIKVTVDAVVTAKVSDSEEGIRAAAQNFLNMSVNGGRSVDMKKDMGISGMIDNILDGSLREIIGQIDLEDLVRSRDEVTTKVKDSAEKDLKKLGIILETFNIQKFEDSVRDSDGNLHSMIESLGAEKTAAILRDSAISRANAEAETEIAKADAKKRSNDAEVESQLAIANKKNELAVREADLKQIADTKKAMADAAYEIEMPNQQKTINITQAEAEVAKQKKEIEIREQKVAVTQKELEAEIQKTAEANKMAQIQKSDAELYQQQKDAEAHRYQEEQRAEAIKAVANAEKEKAFAEAAAVKAKGEAEAAAVKAKGLAEAEALDKKADAMQKYGDAARQEMQLKTLEKYFEQLPGIAASVAKPMEKIGNITMYGEGNTAKLTGDITKTLTQISSGLTDSMGISLPTIINSMFGAKLAGVNGGSAAGVNGGSAAEAQTKKIAEW